MFYILCKSVKRYELIFLDHIFFKQLRPSYLRSTCSKSVIVFRFGFLSIHCSVDFFHEQCVFFKIQLLHTKKCPQDQLHPVKDTPLVTAIYPTKGMSWAFMLLTLLKLDSQQLNSTSLFVSIQILLRGYLSEIKLQLNFYRFV